jgi:MFS family permease
MSSMVRDGYLGAVLAALGAGLAPLSFGFTVAFTSPAMAAMTRPRSEGGVLTEEEMASFSAVVTFTAAIGSLLAGPCADSVGRQRTLVGSMVPVGCGFAAIACGQTAAQLLVGRALTGVGIGAVSVVTPMYLTEIAPPSLRGALGCVCQLGIVVGILLVYVLGFEIVPTAAAGQGSPPTAAGAAAGPGGLAVAGVRGWRLLALLGCVPPALLLLLSPLLPESPHWLATSEYPDRLLDSLRCLRTMGRGRGREQQGTGTADDGLALVRDEAAALQRAMKGATLEEGGQPPPPPLQGGGSAGDGVVAGARASVRMLLYSASAAAPFRIACVLNVAQQLSGINVVNMFASTILADAGVQDPQQA